MHPDALNGWGVLTVAGSSGRVDSERARTFARVGVLAESIRWFGGEGQQPAPYQVPVEQFQRRVEALRTDCDRVLLSGTSFGAEAVLLVAACTPGVDAVVAFAPSDVVWAGVRPDGTQTSHWTLGGVPLPYVRFLDSWEPQDDPPSYTSLYEQSYAAADEQTRMAAQIPVERLPTTVLIAGGDDRVWPAVEQAERIAARRAAYGLATTTITIDGAGHRAVLPGEDVVRGGQRLARGGVEARDRELGAQAWQEITRLWTG